jgi:hypothetical protein
MPDQGVYLPPIQRAYKCDQASSKLKQSSLVGLPDGGSWSVSEAQLSPHKDRMTQLLCG